MPVVAAREAHLRPPTALHQAQNDAGDAGVQQSRPRQHIDRGAGEHRGRGLPAGVLQLGPGHGGADGHAACDHARAVVQPLHTPGAVHVRRFAIVRDAAGAGGGGAASAAATSTCRSTKSVPPIPAIGVMERASCT